MKHFYPKVDTPFPELFKRIKQAISASIEDPSLPHILISTPSHRKGYLKSTVHQYDRTNPDKETLKRLTTYSELIKDSTIRCLCNPENPCLLYLREYDSHYSLAKHPGTKDQHCPHCGFALFGLPANPNGRGLTFADVASKDVSTKSLLATPTSSHRQKVGNTGKKRKPSGGKRTLKASVGTGVLLSMIQTSGLNVHLASQGAPTWHEAAARLVRAAEITTDDGAYLRANLVVAGYDNEIEVRQRLADKSPLLVVGRLISQERHSGKRQRSLYFDGWEQAVIATDSSVSYGSDHSTYRGAKGVMNSLGESGNPETIVILVVRLNEDGELVGTKLSYVMTTEQYIPVVSSFELEFARHLVKIGHHFLKPIRRTDSSRHLYDFVIFLRTGHYPVEVNGMEEPEYVADKDETEDDLILCYPNHHAIWWAIRGEKKPVLPEPWEQDR